MLKHAAKKNRGVRRMMGLEKKWNNAETYL